MNRAEFIEQYSKIIERAMYLAEKARKEGLLALEDDEDHEKAKARDVFEYGLRFAIDGTDKDIINKLLSNIVNQEKDEQLRILKTIQKEAVLMIRDGTNPRLTYAILNSYTDIPLSQHEDLMNKLLGE